MGRQAIWTGLIAAGLLLHWVLSRAIRRGNRRNTSDRQHWWMD
jgi:hypothetical protein